MPLISAFYGVTIWMYWDEGAPASQERPIRCCLGRATAAPLPSQTYSGPELR